MLAPVQRAGMGAGGMECHGTLLLRFLIGYRAGGVLHSGYVSEHPANTQPCSPPLPPGTPPRTTPVQPACHRLLPSNSRRRIPTVLLT